MITNYELKLKARTALKDNWQIALMVALIASLPSLANQVVAIMTESNPVQLMNNLMGVMQNHPDVTDVMFLLEEAGITVEKCLPSTLLGIVSALASPFLTLGMLNYFFKLLRGEADATIETVFSRRHCFFKAIGLNIMLAVRICLWMLPGWALSFLGLLLMFISPELALSALPALMFISMVLMMVLGIRASFHYAMADRVMAEVPSKGINQCIRESVNMMRHRKMLLFSLEISFLLLNLGVTLVETLVLGMLGTVLASTVSMALSFVINVYLQTTISAFYLHYRQETAI